MFDARIFIDSLDAAKVVLERENAVFKGEYIIHDIIYKSKDPSVGLEKSFLRLRVVPKNIWDEKSVIVSIKNTEIKEVGKRSIIPVRQEFDNRESAEKFITENYLDTFEYDFEFNRTGWQYFIAADGIDLEDIEGYLSIEYKSETEEGLKKLLEKFDAKDPIKGPSVVKVKEILGR